MTTTLRRLLAGTAALLLAVAAATPVMAHAELVSSSPAEGAVLADSPTEVELRFSEGVAADRSSFLLLGPAGEVGTGTLNRDGGRVLRLAGLALVPGAYEIRWTIGSADGHVERGRIRFTVAEPAPVSASPSAGAASGTAPPTSDPPTASPGGASPGGTSPGAGPAADPSQPASSSGVDVLLPILAALVLVGGAAAYLLRRGRAA